MDYPRAALRLRTPGAENTKNTLCRNITIYGRCKYEKEGCSYNHDIGSANNAQTVTNTTSRKGFNVDSPSFQPLQPVGNGASTGTKSASISPRAANAAVFTPKSIKSNVATPRGHSSESSGDWSAQAFHEFVPQTYDTSQLADPSVTAPALNPYSTYNASSASLAAAGQQANPYAQDASTLSGAAYYQNANPMAQPPQYHLYFPLGPYRENLLAYQKIAHNFFIPDDLREELQRKSEAAHQVLPNSALPEVEHYHTLVPLDTNNQRNVTLFGYPSWVYKAVSGKDGKTYVLRRLENYRLTNEKAIRSVQSWKRINNGGVVKIHDAFTTRAFGDSSLIFVTDYFPRSKTLAQEHLNYTPAYNRGRPITNQIPEATLWGYITQIASALKAVHSNGLAARVINLSKVIVTSKNRIRLNGCAILDVTQYDMPRPLQELQVEDLTQLGRLILCLANNNQNATLNIQKSLEHVGRTCSLQLKDCITWLLTAAPPSPGALQSPSGAPAPPEKTIDAFLQGITTQIMASFDNTLHATDTLSSALSLELENGRLVRLLAKLNFVTERPEFEHNPLWAETGERYYLKLFRDYVFHSVDANNKPVTDLGHVIAALNKLDAGSEEKVMLISRDEQNVLMVSYRDVKRMVESCFLELVKGGARR